MVDLLQDIPKTDPLAIPDQRAVIDRILEENQDLPGAVMVVLGELQSTIGFISPAMQIYVANRMRVPRQRVHGVVSFYSFFTTTAARQAYGEILHGHGLLRRRHAAAYRESQTGAGHRARPHHRGRHDHAGSLPLCGRLQPGAGGGDRRRLVRPRQAQQVAADFAKAAGDSQTHATTKSSLQPCENSPCTSWISPKTASLPAPSGSRSTSTKTPRTTGSASASRTTGEAWMRRWRRAWSTHSSPAARPARSAWASRCSRLRLRPAMVPVYHIDARKRHARRSRFPTQPHRPHAAGRSGRHAAHAGCRLPGDPLVFHVHYRVDRCSNLFELR